jgi:hypothetical protein
MARSDDTRLLPLGKDVECGSDGSDTEEEEKDDNTAMVGVVDNFWLKRLLQLLRRLERPKRAYGMEEVATIAGVLNALYQLVKNRIDIKCIDQDLLNSCSRILIACQPALFRYVTRDEKKNDKGIYWQCVDRSGLQFLLDNFENFITTQHDKEVLTRWYAMELVYDGSCNHLEHFVNEVTSQMPPHHEWWRQAADSMRIFREKNQNLWEKWEKDKKLMGLGRFIL